MLLVFPGFAGRSAVLGIISAVPVTLRCPWTFWWLVVLSCKISTTSLGDESSQGKSAKSLWFLGYWGILALGKTSWLQEWHSTKQVIYSSCRTFLRSKSAEICQDGSEILDLNAERNIRWFLYIFSSSFNPVIRYLLVSNFQGEIQLH